MKIVSALTKVDRIFLDTAPVIYHIEGTHNYQPLTDIVFQKIQDGSLEAITSTIRLNVWFIRIGTATFPWHRSFDKLLLLLRTLVILV